MKTIDFIRQSGRPRILSVRDRRGIIRKIKKKPQTNAPKLAKML